MLKKDKAIIKKRKNDKNEKMETEKLHRHHNRNH